MGVRYGTMLVLATGMAGAGCGGAPAADPGSGEPSGSDATGQITAALTQVPNGVVCIRVTVARTGVTTPFTVNAGQSSASLSLGQLPLGTTTISASAYIVACASVTSSTTANWVSAPVSVNVLAGLNPQVTMTLVPNVSTTASVNFVTPAVSLAVGGASSFAVDAMGNVRAWGFDGFGELGDGTAVFSHPLPIASSVVGQVTRIGTGDDHACAVTAAGALECWGYNADGELGDGTTVSPRLTPVQPFASGVARVAGGANHTCAVKADGSVVCTGLNSFGQLGNGTTTNSSTFVQALAAGTADQVAAGGIHTCARGVTGVVYCWGANANGQLGIGGAGGPIASPNNVGTLRGVAEIRTGANHTCARKFDGTVWCWGSNAFGQIGDGTTIDRASPIQVSGIFGAVQIATGQFHSCAALQDGSVQCWGDDAAGEVGDGSGGTNNMPLTPVPVRNLASAVVEIATQAASAHTCARLDSGVVQCWGFNQEGQIGDGTLANAFVATTVAF
jgi:alpha-tubulin suppressor-like RCC1 family protein